MRLFSKLILEATFSSVRRWGPSKNAETELKISGSAGVQQNHAKVRVEIQKRPHENRLSTMAGLYGRPAGTGILNKYKAEPSKVKVMEGISGDKRSKQGIPSPHKTVLNSNQPSFEIDKN